MLPPESVVGRGDIRGETWVSPLRSAGVRDIGATSNPPAPAARSGAGWVFDRARQDPEVVVIKLKRVYEEPAKDDGTRILVERLWPRGFTKERAAIDLWLKDIAPSPELRTWFGHDPEKWDDFRERYRAELERKKDLVELLRQKSRGGTITFVYAARDEEHNAAVALKQFLEHQPGSS